LEFRPAAGSPGQVGALRGTEVSWQAEGGRLQPVPVPGSEFIKETDLVLLAMGFTGPEPGQLSQAQAIKADPGGRLGPGLYAAGDAANGPSLAVRAIRDGLKTAGTIISDYLCLAETGS
jgi:glutamate synthase (NADPH/NADH) small chain